MKGVRDRDELVANAIADQTAEGEQRLVSVWLHTMERPSGPRTFVQLVVTEQVPATRAHPINLEPEQARRLAEQLEHGADLADREPVKLVRALVAQLAYYHGENLEPILEQAKRWLERHDTETDL